MPRVFVIHEPLRRDPQTGEWGRAMNLRPAQEYGDLIHVLPTGAQPADPRFCLRTLRDTLTGPNGYTADDYLLLVGAPEYIAFAGALACRQTCGVVRVLIWDRMAKRYKTQVADVYAAEPSHA